MTRQAFSAYGSHRIVLDFIRGKKTGTLVFYPGARKLFFEKGNLVFAGSEVKAEHFAEILVRDGVLDGESLHRLQDSLAPGESLGKALKTRGLATARQLAQALKQQISQIVIAVVDQDEGECQILEDVLPNKLPKLKIHTLSLIIQSLIQSESARNFSRLPIAYSICKTDEFSQIHRRLSFPPAYEDLLELIAEHDRALSEDLSLELGMDLEVIDQLAYVLKLMGMVRFEAREPTGNLPKIPDAVEGDDPEQNGDRVASEDEARTAPANKPVREPVPDSVSRLIPFPKKKTERPPPEALIEPDRDGDAVEEHHEPETAAVSLAAPDDYSEPRPPVLELSESEESVDQHPATAASAFHHVLGSAEKTDTQSEEADWDHETREYRLEDRAVELGTAAETAGTEAQDSVSDLEETKVILYEPEEASPPYFEPSTRGQPWLIIGIVVGLLLLIVGFVYFYAFPLGSRLTHTEGTQTADLAESANVDDANAGTENTPMGAEETEPPVEEDPIPIPSEVMAQTQNATTTTQAGLVVSEDPPGEAEPVEPAQEPAEITAEAVAPFQGDFDDFIARSRQRAQALAGDYSIAFIVACQPDTVERILATYNGSDIYMFNRKLGQRSCYLLTWGNFQDNGEALRAKGNLPPFLKDQSDSPWVVKVREYL